MRPGGEFSLSAPGHLRWLAAALALASLPVGCRKSERTMVVFEVGSNLRPAIDWDRAELSVTLGRKTTTSVFPVTGPGAFALPLSLGVVEAKDGLGPVDVVATAFLGSASVAHETAIVDFVEGQSRLLKLYLVAECAADPCIDPAMTCTKGGVCVPKARPPSDLVPVGPNEKATPDAAVARVPDAARDVGNESGVEVRFRPDLAEDRPDVTLPDLAPNYATDTSGSALDLSPDKVKALLDAALPPASDGAVPSFDVPSDWGDLAGLVQLDGGADMDMSAADLTVDATVDATAPGPPSCQGLPATCGFSGQENCCASLPVPGGVFDRSNDPAYPATVDAFRLDEFEVTVGRFRAFMTAGLGTQASPPTAGVGAHPRIADSGWNSAWNTSLAVRSASLRTQLKCDNGALPLHAWTWTDTPGGNETRPLNCVDWYTAFAFCAWDGGRLPTEAEWNFAAAGGDEQRDYPWGSGIDYSNASYSCAGDGDFACTLTDLVPVGSKSLGMGRWGHFDMAGNVSEWTLDWFTDYAVPCVNCANIASGAAFTRVNRGGAFTAATADVASEHRVGDSPTAIGYPLGIRCARDR